MAETSRQTDALPEETLRQRARSLAAPAKEVTLSTDELGWLVVRVGGGRYALRLDALDGLVRLPSTVPLPDAPSMVTGLANIHGRAMTVVDLGTLLGASPSPPTAAVLVPFEGSTVALGVESYEGVATYPETAVQPPTPGLSRCVRGIGPTGVGIIDPTAVLDGLRAISTNPSGSEP